MFSAIAGRGGVREPRTWLAAILATVTIEVLGGLLVSTAIWLHQGHFDVDGFGWLALGGVLAAATNACFALVAVLLISVARCRLCCSPSSARSCSSRTVDSPRFDNDTPSSKCCRNTRPRSAKRSHSRKSRVRRCARDATDCKPTGPKCGFFPPTAAPGPLRVTLDGDNTSPRHEFRHTDDRRTLGPAGERRTGTRHQPQRRATPAHRELLTQYECTDLVAAPLLGEHGIAGVLLLRDRLGDVGTFDAADGRLLSALGRYTSIALENGRLVDELQVGSRPA